MVKERHFDRIAKNYDLFTKTLMLGTYDKARNRIIKLGNSDAQRALDLCCGTGYLTGSISAQQVIGIDLSRGMLERNRHKHLEKNIPLIRGDAFNLPLEEDSFDSVYCSLAAHEFRDVKPILKEAHRILRKGGNLIIFDIFKPSFPPSWFLIMILVKYLAEFGKMWVYNQDEWERMLMDIGFKEVDARDFYKTAILIKAAK